MRQWRVIRRAGDEMEMDTDLLIAGVVAAVLLPVLSLLRLLGLITPYMDKVISLGLIGVLLISIVLSRWR